MKEIVLKVNFGNGGRFFFLSYKLSNSEKFPAFVLSSRHLKISRLQIIGTIIVLIVVKRGGEYDRIFSLMTRLILN